MEGLGQRLSSQGNTNMTIEESSQIALTFLTISVGNTGIGTQIQSIIKVLLHAPQSE
jgi:hypothetical protein